MGAKQCHWISTVPTANLNMLTHIKTTLDKCSRDAFRDSSGASPHPAKPEGELMWESLHLTKRRVPTLRLPTVMMPLLEV